MSQITPFLPFHGQRHPIFTLLAKEPKERLKSKKKRTEWLAAYNKERGFLFCIGPDEKLKEVEPENVAQVAKILKCSPEWLATEQNRFRRECQTPQFRSFISMYAEDLEDIASIFPVCEIDPTFKDPDPLLELFFDRLHLSPQQKKAALQVEEVVGAAVIQVNGELLGVNAYDTAQPKDEARQESITEARALAKSYVAYLHPVYTALLLPSRLRSYASFLDTYPKLKSVKVQTKCEVVSKEVDGIKIVFVKASFTVPEIPIISRIIPSSFFPSRLLSGTLSEADKEELEQRALHYVWDEFLKTQNRLVLEHLKNILGSPLPLIASLVEEVLPVADLVNQVVIPYIGDTVFYYNGLVLEPDLDIAEPADYLSEESETMEISTV